MPTFIMQLDAKVQEAFDVAYDNIYAFHLAQRSPEKSIENMKVSASYLCLSILNFEGVYKKEYLCVI